MKAKIKWLFWGIIVISFFCGIKPALALDEVLLHIEYPVSKEVGKTLEVSGWVMSKVSNEIEVYLDDEALLPPTRGPRSDVLKTIKDYGDASINPTPGFKGVYDLEKYKDGDHTLTVKVLDSEKKVLTTETKKITLKKYKTLLHLEEPVKKVMGTKLKIGGWVMSLDKTLEVKLALDGQELTPTRIARSDVLKAVKGYGDASTNPTPGFSQTLDVSTYQDGTHKIKITLVHPETGEVIHAEEHTFTLEKYKSNLYLENPATTSISGTKLKVGGWVMSTNPNADIQIYLDDIKQENIMRYQRPDVIKAVKGYGDATTNPQAGFEKTIDLSSIKDGKHTVIVRMVEKGSNNLIKEIKKTINIVKHKTKMIIEDPSNLKQTGTSLKIGGWVMSTAPNSVVKVLMDGKNIEGVSRKSRNDVIKAVKGYGDNIGNPEPGFSLQYDMRFLKDGLHQFTVQVINPLTQEVLSQQSKSFELKKYRSKGYIDAPDEKKVSKTTLQVDGWVMSTTKDISFELYIDGVKTNISSINRLVRNDVLKSVKDYGTVTKEPGYQLLADVSRLKDGSHKIDVKIIDINTKEVLLTMNKQIKIKKYDGKIYLESPNRSVFNQGFTISGWEMSELDQSYLKYYLDGKEVKLQTTRGARQDVLDAIKDYGSAEVNATPYFSADLDLANVKEGDHTLEVKLYSRLNEELTKVSKKIVVYKKVYFGIDVSSYQGKINWYAVKNEGIDFAIVRLGFRGYGSSGSLNLDTKYQNNVTEVRKNGLKLGIYFYSQATTEEEAKEEANYVIHHIELAGIKDAVKYPVIFDTEFTEAKPNGRADSLDKSKRTKIAKAFLETIKKAGYKPMIYASRDFFYNELNMNELSSYDVWVAHYNETRNPVTEGTDYTGVYHMWQYTSSGSLTGINGRVDLDISYKNYS